jgi:predicted O-methyltransferase YrrM
VLEIGTHVGGSTIHIAAALAKIGDEPKLITVDVEDVNDAPNASWKNYGLPRSPRDALAQLGLAERVQFCATNSFDYFARRDQLFDFIFLDGDHSAATVYQELALALGHLRPGGTILLHDFFPGLRSLWSNGSVIRGPQLAVARYQREGSDIVVRPLGALPWPTKLGSNITSLALATRS